jgi:uncharacterized protein (TIGR00730 family)
VLKRLCVFCGSSVGARREYVEAVRSLGALLAKRKIALVFGGGGVGLMGELADAALDAGGEVIGVLPQALGLKEVGHPRLTDLRLVDSMHARKAMMAELSDGFIAAPGGLGTLDELFEIWTWGQLGLHDKPCGLLDVGGYFTSLLRFLDSAVDERFVRQEHREMLLVAEGAGDLIDRFEHYTPPRSEKWLDRGDT